MPAPLQIRLKKGRDGHVASFALHRANGTVTVMRNPNPFFPVHDLTHYAVESVLRHRRGFYGLVSEGWNFEDFGTPWPRGPLPPDTEPAEFIVGMFDLERATGIEMTIEDINEQLQRYAAEHPATPRAHLSPPQLDEVRRRVRAYAERWATLAPGDTLVLDYAAGEDRGTDSAEQP
jgi:hypothetical protein